MLKDSHSKSIRELNVITKISQNIIRTLDYEKVLQIISDGMSELLEIETAAIYTLENEKDLYLGATTPPLDPHMPNEFRKALLKDHYHIEKAVLSRNAVLVKDTKTEKMSPAEKIILEARKMRSLLFFPFIQNDEVLGVLILGTCNNPREFTDQEIGLGQTVANQLAMAIKNTKLHIDLKNSKENLEHLVTQRTRELKETNDELHATNDELFQKNELVMQQKEELETTLNHLKSMQVKLIQSEKMASLGILTAGVAHEINNPLNFIMGAYIGLETFFTETAPKYKNQVKVLLNGIKIGIDRASGIVQGLNQFSRDNKTITEDCEIHTIINNCLVMLHNQYKNEINITKRYLDGNVIIKGNSGKLHQVFLNILTNSIQSIEKKGDIFITTAKSKDEVTISIRDTGCGIEKENLHKITDPFFTTKNPQQGTGLGLSITYNIIQEHKGGLEFESKVNKGTTVKITLPVNQ